MSRCFGTPSNLSAKDYTYKKRNFNMFCDLRNKFIANNFKPIGTTVACLNSSGIISQFNNQSSQLNIKKGFEEFSITHRPADISKNYIGQQIKNNFCSPYNDISNNVDISNNYTYNPPFITLAAGGMTGQTIEIESRGTWNNRYAEINNDDDVPTGTAAFPNGKKIIYEICPIRDSGRIQVITGDELPPPLISSFELIFV